MPWVVTLTILVASAFLMDMSFTMITPFLPVYLSSALGAKASTASDFQNADCLRSDSRVFILSSANPAALHCSASRKHGQHHDAFRDDIFCLRDFDHDCFSDSRSGWTEVWLLKGTFVLFVLRRSFNLRSSLGTNSV